MHHDWATEEEVGVGGGGRGLVLEVKTNGQLEVQLDGGALELPPQRVKHRHIDLWPVERAIAWVELRGKTAGRRSGLVSAK